MPWCKQCNQEYIEGTKTCPECGTKLTNKSLHDSSVDVAVAGNISESSYL